MKRKAISLLLCAAMLVPCVSVQAEGEKIGRASCRERVFAGV